MIQDDIRAIEDRAQSLLAERNLHDLPIDVEQLALDMHVSVSLTLFDSPDTRAKASLRDGVYSIEVREFDSINLIRCTMAHSLGHVVLGHLGEGQTLEDDAVTLYHMAVRDERLTVEQKASVFACALLMPAEAVQAAYAADTSISVLALRFMTPEHVTVKRLEYLGLI